jgi:poly(3-hydroxyoctanoate) depolymerase
VTVDAPRFVAAGGVRIRVSVEGDGPPLLMINGLGSNIEMWRPLRSRLDGLQTVAFDAPGTGESETFQRPVRMRRLARLVVDILDDIGCRSVDVLGFSFGGMVAQQLAHDWSARVHRLVLAATTPGVGGVLGRPRAMALLMSPRRYRDVDYLRSVAPIVYSGRVAIDPSFIDDQQHARMARPPTNYGYASQIYASLGWSSLRWLHRVQQPTLVLAGARDPVTPAANGRIMAAAMPNAKLRVIAGAGHLFPLDTADEVAPLILDWLA